MRHGQTVALINALHRLAVGKFLFAAVCQHPNIACPEEARDFSLNAKANGVEVIICAAGKAAHLGGVIAASTTLPVIGLPVKTDMMGGLDSLLSIVQMPSGIPVATVGVNAGENAGLLALQILGIKYPEIAAKLADYKLKMKDKINSDDAAIQAEIEEILA